MTHYDDTSLFYKNIHILVQNSPCHLVYSPCPFGKNSLAEL